MSTLAERLKIALTQADKTQAELARACGIAPASVHGWLTGRTQNLKGLSLLKAAAFLQVRGLWLAEGRGPMNGDAVEGVQDVSCPSTAWPFWAITPERYGALPPYLKGMIEGRVQSMIEEWESSARAKEGPPQGGRGEPA